MNAKIILIAIAVFSQLPSAGQTGANVTTLCKEKMAPLSYFVGKWKGTATYRRGPGPAIQIEQEELVSAKLDGTALLVEGTGRNTDGIAFQAMAVINFNPADSMYHLKSYLKEGLSTDAYFLVLDENTFEWGFAIPAGGKVRYSIKLDPTAKTWREIGEYSADGNKWFETTRLDLTKIE